MKQSTTSVTLRDIAHEVGVSITTVSRILNGREMGVPIRDEAGQHRRVVGVTDRIARRRVPGVYADSVAGTRLAMDHLWSLGHRRIVCLADPGTSDGPLRASEYERYMREHGAADELHVYFTTQ